MNRWRALVEVVRILAGQNRPGLAFAAVCIIALPIACLGALLIYLLR